MTVPEIAGKTAQEIFSKIVPRTRKVGNVPLSADIPVTLTGDTAITVTNTGAASAIGYSVAHNDSGVTAGSKGDTANQTPAFGGTFKALGATVDAKGHVTALGDHTVKVPSDTATTSKDGLMSKTDKAKLDAIGVTASAPLEVTKSGETYNVTLKDSGVTAGSKGDTANQTPAFGGTFKALSATVDAKGRVTALAEHSVEVPDTEATQSAKGLMSAADKTKLDTLIDATLSNESKAADAKAAGDKIAALESENALLRELINGVDAPIYRSASGNPVSFDDGYAANVRDLTVTMTPTQEGSGDPYPPGGGKNLLDFSNVSNTTSNGVTLTVSKNVGGAVTSMSLTGTSSAYVPFNSEELSGLTDGESYTISDGGGYRYTQCAIFDSTLQNFVATPYVIGSLEISDTFVYDASHTYKGVIFVSAGAASNKTLYPMLRRASDADPTFVPYSNIRPITGVSSVGVTRTGKNLLDVKASAETKNGVTLTVNRDAGGNVVSVTLNGTLNTASSAYFLLNDYATKFKPENGVQYILTGAPSGGNSSKYRLTLENIGFDYGDGFSFTGDGNLHYVSIEIFPGYAANNLVFYPMIRRASDADPAFEPYQGQTVSVTLTDGNSNPLTVYGGSLDVTTGTLSVTHRLYTPTGNEEWSVQAGSNGIHRFSRGMGVSVKKGVCSHLPTLVSWSNFDIPHAYVENTTAVFFLPLSEATQAAMNSFIADQIAAGTPLQILCELETPVTYTLTPATLAALHGYNAVSADAGSVSVEYRADVGLTLDALENNLTNAILSLGAGF